MVQSEMACRRKSVSWCRSRRRLAGAESLVIGSLPLLTIRAAPAGIFLLRDDAPGCRDHLHPSFLTLVVRAVRET